MRTTCPWRTPLRLRLGKTQTHSIETENTFYREKTVKRENTIYRKHILCVFVLVRSRHAMISKRTKASKRAHYMPLRLGKKQTNMHGDLYVAYRDEEEGTHAIENTFCLCVVWWHTSSIPRQRSRHAPLQRTRFRHTLPVILKRQRRGTCVDIYYMLALQSSLLRISACLGSALYLLRNFTWESSLLRITACLICAVFHLCVL